MAGQSTLLFSTSSFSKSSSSLEMSSCSFRITRVFRAPNRRMTQKSLSEAAHSEKALYPRYFQGFLLSSSCEGFVVSSCDNSQFCGCREVNGRSVVSVAITYADARVGRLQSFFLFRMLNAVSQGLEIRCYLDSSWDPDEVLKS